MDYKLNSAVDYPYQFPKFLAMDTSVTKRPHCSIIETSDGDNNDFRSGQDQTPENKRVKWSADLKREVITRLLSTGETKAKLSRYYNLPESTIRTWLNSELGRQIKKQIDLSAMKSFKSNDFNCDNPDNELLHDFMNLSGVRNPVDFFFKRDRSREGDPVRRARSDSGISICSESSSDFVDHQEVRKRIECLEDSNVECSIPIYGEKFDDLSVAKSKEYLQKQRKSDAYNKQSYDGIYLPAYNREKMGISTAESQQKQQQQHFLSQCDIDNSPSDHSRRRDRKIIIRSTELKKEVITRLLITGETKAKLGRQYNLPESTIRTWQHSKLGRRIKDQLEYSMMKNLKPIEEIADDSFEKSADVQYIGEVNNDVPTARPNSVISISSDSSSDIMEIQEVKKNSEDTDIVCLTDLSSLPRREKVNDFVNVSEPNDYVESQETNDITVLGSFPKNYQTIHGMNSPTGYLSTEPQENAENLTKEHLNLIESMECDENRSPNQQSDRKWMTRSTELKKEVITRILITGEPKAQVCRLYNLPESTVRTWMKSLLGQRIKRQLEFLALNHVESVNRSKNPIDRYTYYCNEKSADLLKFTEAKTPIDSLEKENTKYRHRRARSDSAIGFNPDVNSINTDNQEVKNNVESFEPSLLERLPNLLHSQVDFDDCREIDKSTRLSENTDLRSTNFPTASGRHEIDNLPHLQFGIRDRLQYKTTKNRIKRVKHFDDVNSIDSPISNRCEKYTDVWCAPKAIECSREENYASYMQRLLLKFDNRNFSDPQPNAKSPLNQELKPEKARKKIKSVINFPLGLLISYCIGQLNLLIVDESAVPEERIFVQRTLTRLHYCSVYLGISREEILELILFLENLITAKTQRAAEASIRLHHNLKWSSGFDEF